MQKTSDIEQNYAALRLENEVLRSFVDTSRDAHFCIEFLEPIDLAAPESEIVRQVFENDCVWRMCNTVMARLYKLPEGLDFNAQNVRFVFSRNRENEQFVRDLIAAGFDIDGALSLDHDYEGREIFMENDVRALISDGMLHRMMGTVRNISQKKVREQALTDRLKAMSDVLSAIPDPVLVVDTNGLLQAANPALGWKFGWHLDDILGHAVSTIVQFPDDFSLLSDISLQDGDKSLVLVEVLNSSGGTVRCEAHVSSFGETNSERRVVITLRSEKVQRTMPFNPADEAGQVKPQPADSR